MSLNEGICPTSLFPIPATILNTEVILGRKVTSSKAWVFVTVECHISSGLFTSVLFDEREESKCFICKAAVI